MKGFLGDISSCLKGSRADSHQESEPAALLTSVNNAAVAG